MKFCFREGEESHGNKTAHLREFIKKCARSTVVVVQCTYMIFVLFSPQTQCFAQFFSTQKCVNRDKNSVNCQKKNWFYDSLMQQNTMNCTDHFSTLQIFFTFLKWRAFSKWKFISWRISPHDNLLCEEISPHDKKILHRHRLWCLWQISGMTMY